MNDIPEDAATDLDGNVIRTRSGRVMTSSELKALADEAEQGYDVADLNDRRVTRYPDGRVTIEKQIVHEEKRQPPVVKWVILAAAIVAGIGSVLPWVTATAAFASISVNGTEGDGKITLALAAIVAVVAISPIFRWSVIPALGLFGAAGYELVHVMQKVSNYNNDHDIARAAVGYGLWITAVAAAVTFIAAAVALGDRRAR